MNLGNSFITALSVPVLPLQSLPTGRLIVCFSSDTSQRFKLAESLQSETLKVLQWPAVCAQLAAFTSTPMGLNAASSARIPLGRTFQESRKLLDQTSAAVCVPRPLDFSGIDDVSPIVDSAVAGEMLSIPELCMIGRTLFSARHLIEQLEDISADKDLSHRYASLLEIFNGCNFLVDLEEKIKFCIDCKFSKVLDRASDELELIRSERKWNMENLEILLKQQATRIFQAGGIGKPLVITRRSRMCISVRTSLKSLLPNGVVLGVSSSGATYFMEPKEAIELNNEEVRLSDYEKIEERKILSILTYEITKFKTEIKYVLDRMMELDLSFARAAHAQWISGVCPVLSSKSSEDNLGPNSLLIDIDCIQHPLLLESSLVSLSDLAPSESRKLYMSDLSRSVEIVAPVPIDIKIRNGIKVLVISGPNTGGKTASMKTLGLSSVMVKAGMFLPAKNHPRLPWFEFILADIGDHQSLEQNLSTFSGHISRLCQIFEVASEKSLVLIDEIGSGTDPSEGTALSSCILQYLKDIVQLAVVTTHYADLTKLKDKDSSFENAAVEFSMETLRPTYRMLWGSTGDSNALNIAKKIGIDEKILLRAQEWLKKLTPEKMEMRKSLLYHSLMEERNKLEKKAEIVECLHSEVMDLYHEMRDEAADLDRRVAALKAREALQLQEELKDVKKEIDTVVHNFENQSRFVAHDQLNLLLKQSESAIASIIEAHRHNIGAVSETSNNSFIPKIGEPVQVKSLGNKLATVVEEPGVDGMALVQYGRVKVRVDLGDIRALGDRDVIATRASALTSRMKGGSSKSLKGLKNLVETNNADEEEVSYGPAVQTSKNTVDLRGMRAEEATRNLEMAINSSGAKSVIFVIHGMGTGAIKECALNVMKRHPRVSKFEQESPMNYGCTIAYIE